MYNVTFGESFAKMKANQKQNQVEKIDNTSDKKYIFVHICDITLSSYRLPAHRGRRDMELNFCHDESKGFLFSSSIFHKNSRFS